MIHLKNYIISYEIKQIQIILTGYHFFKTLKIVFLDEDPGTGQVGPGVSTKFINHLQ